MDPESPGNAAMEALALLVSPHGSNARPSIDYRHLAELARRCELEAALAWRWDSAPADLAERWEAAARTAQAAHVLRMEAWDRISQAFESVGVPFLPLKGMDLILSNLLEPGRRPMKDIDILVQASDLDRAKRAMQESGFRLSHELPGQTVFGRSLFSVEIHHWLYPRPLPFADPEPAVWDRAVRIRGEGMEHRLAPADRLAYLCLHYYLGEVRRVRSASLLRDLAAVLERSSPQLSTSRCVEQARAGGWGVFLRERLCELDRLLSAGNGLPIAQEMISELPAASRRANIGFRFCRREAERRTFSERREGSEPGLRFYLLFWAPLRHLPALLLGAGSRQGGGWLGRGKRLLTRAAGRD